ALLAGKPAAAAGPAAPDPAGPSPLTGIAGAAPDRPALVVKIDNAPAARPQSGLNQADVVYEELVEGRLTRFAAVFHSQDSTPVGPVRSARSTDIFQDEVRRAPLVDVGYHAAPDRYEREPSRHAPYNLFSRTPALCQLAPRGSVAGQAPAGAGMAATDRVSARWATRVDWQWDPAVGEWRRSQDGRPHVDAAGRAIAPANVVVEFVTYRDTGLRDRSGAAVPEAELTGEGDAWILTGGALIP